MSNQLLLKTQTDSLHKRIETSLIDFHVMDNLESYQKFLRVMFSFYTEIEKRLDRYSDELQSSGIDLKARSKVSLLRSDLNFFRLPLNLEETKTPVIDGKGSAMGVLYVLEGSTLGGQVVLKRLLANKVISASDQGGRFYNGYGDVTGQMWMKFKDVLNQMSPAETSRAIESAQSTFAKMDESLRSIFRTEE